MMYKFDFYYSYKIEDNGEVEHCFSSVPLFAPDWQSAKEKGKQLAFDMFGGLENPFTIYGGAKVTLMHYVVKWKLTP